MDLYPDGKVSIIDFKSGQPGSMKLDDKLDLQLSALALMTEAGGFSGPGARKVCWLGYWSLSDPDYAGMLDPKAKGAIGPDAMEEHLQNFRIQLSQLLSQYLALDMTFRSQVRPANGDFEPPFDHLARRREWSFLDAGGE
jgi:RecB family exonuclease